MRARIAVIRIVALIALAGCTRVAAHEREHLARRAMDPERDATETKLDTHVNEYREGSIGGTGAGGGGCGCN